MKNIVLSIMALVIATALAGCGSGSSAKKEVDSDEHAHAEGGVTFDTKHGLRVPAETAEFIGLKIADVEERRVKSTFRFAAQVYRAGEAGKPALASGDVSPDEAHMVKAGQTVKVELDNGAALPGRIAEIEPHTDKETVEHLDVAVEIEDREGKARAGTFANVSVVVGKDEAVVSVPRSSVLQTAEGKFVYTVSGEHLIRAGVKTGVMNDENVEITDGLYSGDKIVVKPVMTLWMAELQSIRGGQACADGH